MPQPGVPAQGQQMQQPQPGQRQGQQPQQIMPQQQQDAGSDANWKSLNQTYERMSRQNPNDPNVASLGSALQQAKQSGNLSVIQPFVQMYIQQQPQAQAQQAPNMGQQAMPAQGQV